MSVDFVNITTTFSNSKDRTIDDFISLYYDLDRLERIIERTIASKSLHELVKKKRVLIKPNWVNHSIKPLDSLCLRTHDNFLLAFLSYILKAEPALVIIGDAPIQGCRWDEVVTLDFIDQVAKLSARNGVPVQIKDFRRRTYTLVNNSYKTNIRPISDYLVFDLGKSSYLEPITRSQPTNFRVTNYDPDRMLDAHSPGIHKYCITRDFLDADIVFSVPKIKTHQKTGITCALKNIVGINGDKDFLPHHRLGGTGRGGDCYPGDSLLRYWSELSLDKANRNQGRYSFWLWHYLSAILWNLSLPRPEHQIAAGWYGNDTTWRMVMDLNLIATFGKKDTGIADHAQRQIFSLCDGIIGGQGDGPLEPSPIPLGVVTFTNNSLINDYIVAQLLGLPVDKIPLIKSAANIRENDYDLICNGLKVVLGELLQYAINAIPPKGWQSIIKKL